MQETLDALAGRLSTRSLQITRLCLERAIRHAEVRDLVGRNVAALIKAPAGRAGRPPKSLTLEQAQDLLRAAVGSRPYAYVVLSVTTGLRTEELRALRWNEVDLDLDAGTVAVYRAVRVTADTKTPKAGACCHSHSWPSGRSASIALARRTTGCWLAHSGKVTILSSLRPSGRPLIVTTCSASSGRSLRRRVWAPTGCRERCATLSCPC